MKDILKNQAKRTGIALAVTSALSAFGTGTALAQTFTSTDFSIEARSNEAKEVAAGDLTCSFREEGLGPYEVVNYDCAADAVGVLEACVYKNKIISATQLSIFKDVSSSEHGGGGEEAALIAGNNGRINGSITTSPGESGGSHQLCPELGEVNGPEPEVEVVAARWCNMSLTDTSNNIVGGMQDELFSVLQRGNFTVPSCTELLASPPTDGGGDGSGGGGGGG
jgi:hypothetical protein